jgi:hypothetical protein
VEVIVYITLGLLVLFGLAIQLTPVERTGPFKPGCWWACAPLLATIPIVGIGWAFQYARHGDDGLKHLVPQYAIWVLYWLGLILGIVAVVRARGMRFLVASVVALELWFSLFVAFVALMFVSGNYL